MPPSPELPASRRSFLGQLVAGTVALSGWPASTPGGPVSVTCLIKYEIDPFQRDAFAEYAAAWIPIIPRCGGTLIGYFLPYEGTNNVAWALINLDSLAAYETYRGKLRTDADARANFAFAQSKRIILKEERTFLEQVRSNGR